MKQVLLDAKVRLLEEKKGLQAHTELGPDVDSHAQEVQIDEVSQNLLAKIHADLEKIEKALHKIEGGTYGHDDAGNEIPEARLRAIPWADKAVT